VKIHEAATIASVEKAHADVVVYEVCISGRFVLAERA